MKNYAESSTSRPKRRKCLFQIGSTNNTGMVDATSSNIPVDNFTLSENSLEDDMENYVESSTSCPKRRRGLFQIGNSSNTCIVDATSSNIPDDNFTLSENSLEVFLEDAAMKTLFVSWLSISLNLFNEFQQSISDARE